MYTTFSVVESSIPPTHQSSSPPSFVKFSPVVVVSFSPPVVKSYQVPLTRSTQFTFTFTHAQSSSREAIYVHAQFTAHEEHPSSRPTHLTLRPYCSTDFVQFLSQTTAEILAPPFAQQTPENPSIDSQTIRSFYSTRRLRLRGTFSRGKELPHRQPSHNVSKSFRTTTSIQRWFLVARRLQSSTVYTKSLSQMAIMSRFLRLYCV